MDIFEAVCILVTLYGLEKIQNKTCSPKVIKCMLHNNFNLEKEQLQKTL